MEELTLTSFSKKDIKELLKESIREVLQEQQLARQIIDNDYPLSIIEVSKLLNLARQTIYGYTSKKLIPHFKKGKKLYFQRSEIYEWIKVGKIKTYDEIIKEADEYLSKKKGW